MSVVPLGEQQSLREDGGYVVSGGSTPEHWGLGQESALGTHEHLGRGEGIPKGARVLKGPRQKVSRVTQVGDKALERSLGETCQSMSPS